MPERAPPRWLVDEMLGRLARYLRFMGHDTAWVRGAEDTEIRARAEREGRTLLTRDRSLAARTPGAVLLGSVQLHDQLLELIRRFPSLPTEVMFDRCSLCNGLVDPVSSPGEGRPAPARPDAGGPTRSVFRCRDCGHEYWEGSHTEGIRRRLKAIVTEAATP
ncbi:MAG TPA: Mut7-C RNAse domain-containing protein [Thermoplasmata archaeon]|nr:Mut7-C RNAse domain-containing protein [Thermoplasmata archaeon]